jgi:hypothetical protein
MTEIKVTRTIDDPSIPEVFIDCPTMNAWVADGVMHLELFAIRRDLPPSPDGETARAHLRARLALPIPASVSLHGCLGHHLDQMEKAGVFKRIPIEAAAPATEGQKH